MHHLALALSSSLVAAGPPPLPHLACGDLPPLFMSMRTTHYAREHVAPKARERSVNQFIQTLDPAKMLLLQKDVERLEKDLLELFDDMHEGDCEVLEGAARLVISRAEEDERFVKKLLGKGYELDTEVELVLDSEQRGYAKTPDERLDRLRRMVHFQISNQLLAGTDLKKARERVTHRYELATKRLQDRRTPERLPELYAEAYASGLDPHSSFLSAETLQDFQIHMRLSLEGIGAVLRSEDGFTVVQKLVPGGQADKQGILRPKDKIVAVAQEGEEPVSIIDMDLRDVVRMIRGEKGTKVTLTVLREGASAKTFDVTIVRDKIDVKEQAAKITYETRTRNGKSYRIGVLELPSFYGGEGGRSSYEDTKKLLREAKANGVDGLVLDLSHNGGGLLNDAVRISGLFIQTGAIVATKAHNGEMEVLADEDDSTIYSGPLVVMVSKVSASASEILAGALKDYGRAVIVGGEHTFGKGTVQQLSRLPGGLGAVKLTMGMFFRPSGGSTQQTGVRSDIRIPSISDGYDIAEKNLDYSLPPQSTPPFLSTTANASGASERWQPVTSSMINRLRKKSEARVAKDELLRQIAKESAEKQEDEGPVKLSELRAEAKEKKSFDEEANKAEYEEKEAAFVDEGVEIAADLVRALNER